MPILKPCKYNVCGKSYNLLNVKLLNACNGKCDWCIASGTYESVNDISSDEMINIINNLTNFDTVDLLGGEPTLYKDLPKICKAIRPYKNKIGIITNGSNIDILFDCINYVDTITFSIHHYDLDNNATKVQINIDKLKELTSMKSGCEIIMACVVNSSGIKDMSDIINYANFAKSLGFDAIKLMELVTSNDKTDFINLQDMLIEYGIHQKNPSLKGCFFELEPLSKYLGIKTYVKLTCPFNNIFKAMDFGIPNNIEFQQNYINVIHPDGRITDSWVYENHENKLLNGEYGINYGNQTE